MFGNMTSGVLASLLNKPLVLSLDTTTSSSKLGLISSSCAGSTTIPVSLEFSSSNNNLPPVEELYALLFTTCGTKNAYSLAVLDPDTLSASVSFTMEDKTYDPTKMAAPEGYNNNRMSLTQ